MDAACLPEVEHGDVSPFNGQTRTAEVTHCGLKFCKAVPPYSQPLRIRACGLALGAPVDTTAVEASGTPGSNPDKTRAQSGQPPL